MQANGVALATGAGRSMGRALALELAKRGFDVVPLCGGPREARP